MKLPTICVERTILEEIAQAGLLQVEDPLRLPQGHAAKNGEKDEELLRAPESAG
jgi:hypothetical protein